MELTILVRTTPFGSLKYLLSKLVTIPNPEEILLKSLMCDNVVKKNEDIEFDTDTHVWSVNETCGGKCPVVGNHIKRSSRCRDHVEKRHYNIGGTKKHNAQ